MRRTLELAALLIVPFLTAVPLVAYQGDQPVWQLEVLYDGALGTTPDQQSFSYLAFGGSAVQTVADNTAVLDTTANREDQAGYFSRQSLALDRQSTFKVIFSIQLAAEQHASPDRAGFSVLILSDDLLGLELAFWEDQIWAQEGGTGSALFTHAEGAFFDTTANVTTYELVVEGDTYTLSADGVPLLSGPLRDYTAFDGFPDPYESPGLFFMGDNTGRGSSRTAVAYVALETLVEPTATPTATDTAQPSATPNPSPSSEPSATPPPTETPQPEPVVLSPEPTQAPPMFTWPTYPLYKWHACLKGVDLP